MALVIGGLFWLWNIAGAVVTVIVFIEIDFERQWNKRNITVFSVVSIASGPLTWTFIVLYAIIAVAFSSIQRLLK